MSARTLSAVRQMLFTALTTPPLTYTVNNGAPQTVPAANVFTIPPFDMLDTQNRPSPLINFQVIGRGPVSLQLEDRRIEIKVWVSGTTGDDDDVTEIMAAIYGLIESPNADGVSPLSRVATGTTLGVLIREVRAIDASAPAFDTISQRIYVDASFSAIAR